MAQFDVHRNRGANRRAIPYVAIVQSSIFDDYRRRVVVPLVKQSYLDQVPFSRFNPSFIVESTPVVLHPLEVVSVATNAWGKFVQSLAHEGQRIIDAMEELITRAHG
ncbi:MAG: CcdB family protein [Pseudomonadales bacterium]|nr:CcdB family protein [Pseudomonadales bacterium]